MPDENPFVGRRAELDRFREVLEEPEGRAVLILGAPQMGKSVLARRMIAAAHPHLQCGAVWYDFMQTDSVDGLMETKAIRESRSPDRMGSSRMRGCLRITSRSPASKASDKARVTAVIILIQSI